jgi:hypothetical protein
VVWPRAIALVALHFPLVFSCSIFYFLPPSYFSPDIVSLFYLSFFFCYSIYLISILFVLPWSILSFFFPVAFFLVDFLRARRRARFALPYPLHVA